MFDEAVLKRGISPVTLSLALSTNAARRFRLEGKGEIAVGFDADLVVIDPNRSYTLEAKDLLYKNPFSAYEGRRIDCRVRDTFVRGMAVWHLGEGILGEAAASASKSTAERRQPFFEGYGRPGGRANR